MINLILSGGSGTRLWPLSRTLLPKQFVRLFDQKSLFQHTVLRNRPLVDHMLVVSNAEQYFLAVDQLTQLDQPAVDFLLEPVGRNTAPAIALACLSLDPEAVVLVTTSDHLIKNQSAYERAVRQAELAAQQGALVTFGVKPEYAETGFGYIEAEPGEGEAMDVKRFHEKPNAEAAGEYLKKGNFFWNSGMFCFKAGVFLEELNLHNPEMLAACQEALATAAQVERCTKVELEAMQAIPEDSIDFAVMEKSSKVKVVPCDLGWSDVGSFDALYDEFVAGHSNNALLKEGSTPAPLCLNSHNNLVVARDRQIALVDVDELLVVDTSDALLISKKGSSQQVKKVVAEVKRKAPALAEVHRLAYRPWGSYEVLVDSEGYKVKRIVVKPGGRLSLQKHFHRNEHWIVVSGTAKVTVDQDKFLLRPNESTYIKMGQVHRLENEGQIELVMIEVQVGEYTGEDDIVRLDDCYHRNEIKP